MQPNISIIVPVYNVEGFIRRAVDSILNQSLKNLEIILVDDGSVDKSGEILDEYKKKDFRIKVIHQKNQGVSAARNAGLALANGQYVGFIDSDDWIEQGMCELLYSVAIKNDCDVVMCDFIYEDNEGKTLRKANHNIRGNFLMEREDIKNEVCVQLLKEGFFTSACDKIYKKSFLDNNNIFFNNAVILREDFFFNMDVFNYAERAIYISEAYYHYRDTPNSALKKYYNNILEVFVAIYKYKLNHMKVWNINSKDVTNKMVCDFLTDAQYCIKNIFNKRNPEGFFKKVASVSEIVNNTLIKKCVEDYYSLNIKKYKKRFERFIIMLVKHKSVFLLSSIYFISGYIPYEYKEKIKKHIN